jgi:hypothetical protein
MPSSVPVWQTPAGSLGTIPEGVFYSIPLLATANETVYYQVIAGKLPKGIQINETGILSGKPQARATIQGVPSDVLLDTTSKFAVRAFTKRTVNNVTVIDKLADRTFTITISGQNQVEWITPPGNIGTYYDGVQVPDLTVEYLDSDGLGGSVVTLVSGALPAGLTISPTGVISGYIQPNFKSTSTTTNYSFTLKVANGTSNDIRIFSILVYSRNTLTADNTNLTADNTFVTADVVPLLPPIITTPIGIIDTVRSDNFFAFQFTGLDFYSNPFAFRNLTELPPGLTLDPGTGWLYGYIPYNGILSATYSFEIQVHDLINGLVSEIYTYSLVITGPVSSTTVWVTPSNPIELAKTPSSLGTIDNGAISTFYVQAVNQAGLPLTYSLVSGSDSRLPQGLELLSSGLIIGRASFDTFALDSGTTTFDSIAQPAEGISAPTTFDLVATFTVVATSVNGLINIVKTFSITVVRRYNQPYDNLYIQAMPPQSDRDLLASLLQNPTVLPPDLIYRINDPNFGIAKKVIYYHAYGLAPATIDDYVSSLYLNHYWKNLVLGNIKTAQALDDDGNIIYEVVYSEVVDNLVNNAGTSVGKEVVTPYVIDLNGSPIEVVYPNSLQDMRDQVIDTVGQISNMLPRWMLSRQSNGQTLGFTPAWVIAYTKPGQSGQIAYNIQTYFGNQLNLVDYKVDRYELDNLLTKNWNREEQYWGYTGDTVTPHPASLTTFDIDGVTSIWINNIGQIVQWRNNNYDQGHPDFISTWTTATPPGTIFDGGSLQFTAPVDMYSTTTSYDKYLVFPKRDILQ